MMGNNGTPSLRDMPAPATGILEVAVEADFSDGSWFKTYSMVGSFIIWLI